MRTLHQTVEIPGATAPELFAIVNPEEAGPYTRFDGAVRGTTLLAVPDRLAVKAWRGDVWREDDLDSIEIMRFEHARIQLVHTAPPEQFVDRWHDLYWEPLRARFSR